MDVYNDSHCLDTTAKTAIEHAEQARIEAAIDKKAKKLFAVLVRTIDLAGFHLENRIEITHRKTGRRYK